jgi:hypothetical protein
MIPSLYLHALTSTSTRLIPKADRKLIHEYLFKEGVLVAKKDYNLPKHGDIDTKNLYVRRQIPHNRRTTQLTSFPGRQGLPIAHLARLPQDPLLLAILLLHPDPRGSRVPARMAAPPRRDRARHAHQAAAQPRPAARHDGW